MSWTPLCMWQCWMVAIGRWWSWLTMAPSSTPWIRRTVQYCIWLLWATGQGHWRFVDWYDDVIKWKHFPRYWPFVRGIHRSPVSSQRPWRGALMSSLICAWANGWLNNHDAGDLRRHRALYDVTVMKALHRHQVIPRRRFLFVRKNLPVTSGFPHKRTVRRSFFDISLNYLLNNQSIWRLFATLLRSCGYCIMLPQKREVVILPNLCRLVASEISPFYNFLCLQWCEIRLSRSSLK